MYQCGFINVLYQSVEVVRIILNCRRIGRPKGVGTAKPDCDTSAFECTVFGLSIISRRNRAEAEFSYHE